MNVFTREMLLGKWYRSESDDQGNQTTEYAEMTADGQFEFAFISHADSGEIESTITELGDWGLVGDIHFTITKSEVVDQHHHAADLTDKDNYQAYRVLELNHHVFEYQHIVTKDVYTLRRIVSD